MAFVYTNGFVLLDDEKMLRCVSFFSYFGVNEMPYAMAVVEPSDNPKFPISYQGIYNSLRSVPYGANVQVRFTLAGETIIKNQFTEAQEVTLFKGKLSGYGHILIHNKPKLVLWIDHWLMPFKWSSALTDDIHGVAAADRAVTSIFGEGDGLVPYTPGTFTQDNVKQDIWKNVIKPELLKLASSSTFNFSNNTDVVKILEDKKGVGYDGSELPLSFDTEDFRTIVSDIRRSIYMPDKDENTIWSKLLRIADRYKFSVIPRINDFSIAPSFPLLAGGNLGAILLQRGFFVDQDYNMRERNMYNAVNMSEGFTSFSYPFDFASRTRRTDEHSVFISDLDKENTRTIRRMSTPPWAYATLTDSFKTAETLGLTAGKKLLSSGYFMEEPAQRDPSNEPTLNETYNTRSGNEAFRYAQTELGEEKYRDRTVVLKCPIFFDYCPGSTIIFEMPTDRRADNPVAHVHIGYVRRVCVSMDQINRRGATWLIVSHLRDQTEQTGLISETHPMYNQKWIRAPLFKVRGFALDQEMGITTTAAS